jgi:hypothetical protein
MKAFDFNDALRKAIDLAKQLAAALASVAFPSGSGGGGGGGGGGELVTSTVVDNAIANADAATAVAEAANAAADAAWLEAEAAQANYEVVSSTLIPQIEFDLGTTIPNLQAEVNNQLAQIKTLNKLIKSGKTKSAQKMIKGMIGTMGGGGTDMLMMAKGGFVSPQYMAGGGMMKPKYFGFGGFAKGTDKIPAMLSPGEFVMSKYAVQEYGLDKMKAINEGSYAGDAVYNYSISVNVKSGANPDEIARSVMTQIKQIDSQRIRTQRVS